MEKQIGKNIQKRFGYFFHQKRNQNVFCKIEGYLVHLGLRGIWCIFGLKRFNVRCAIGSTTVRISTLDPLAGCAVFHGVGFGSGLGQGFSGNVTVQTNHDPNPTPGFGLFQLISPIKNFYYPRKRY